MAVIRVPRLWQSPPRSSAATAVKLVSESEGLDAFGSETESVSGPPFDPISPVLTEEATSEASPTSPSNVGSAIKWTLGFLLIAVLTGVITWQYQRRANVTAPGSLTVQTTPPGIEVLIGGVPVGKTPLTVSLPAGPHRLQVGTAGQRRDIEVNMVSGATIQHNLEIAAATAPAQLPAAGSLQVQTDTPAMAITVDGVERGVSPLTIADLAPGDHQVVVRGEQRTIRRMVSIRAGETLSLVISPIGPVASAPGWLAVSAPVVMQLREGGQLIGTTETEKLMLASGDHDIEIVNEPLGYRDSRRITVAAGKVSSTVVELPAGLLSINAQPWAEVWLDGERVGETPIANLAARLGSHEVLFKHPQLGERRETILVTLHQPARLGVDLRRQQP